MSDEKPVSENTADVDSKRDVDTVAVDDRNKTENVINLGRHDMDPDE